MDDWLYTQGTWQPYQVTWTDDVETDITNWGYRRVMELTDTDAPHSVELYSSDRVALGTMPVGPGTTCPYLVLHTISTTITNIFVASYPDLVELLAKLAPMQHAIEHTAVEMRLQEIQHFTGTAYDQGQAARDAHQQLEAWRQLHSNLTIGSLSTAATGNASDGYNFTISILILP